MRDEVNRDYLTILKQSNIHTNGNLSTPPGHQPPVLKPVNPQIYVILPVLDDEYIDIENVQSIDNWELANLNGRQQRFIEYITNELEIDFNIHVKNQYFIVKDQLYNELQSNITNMFKLQSARFIKQYLDLNNQLLVNIQRQLFNDIKDKFLKQITIDSLSQNITNYDSPIGDSIADHLENQSEKRRLFVLNNTAYEEYYQQGLQLVRKP